MRFISTHSQIHIDVSLMKACILLLQRWRFYCGEARVTPYFFEQIGLSTATRFR
jgi:hypothetical protein